MSAAFSGGSEMGLQPVAQGPYDEHYSRVPAEQLLAMRLNGDFPGMLGALGLQGDFVPYPQVDTGEGDYSTSGDHWRGAYVEGDQVRDMQLHANEPGRLASRLAQRFGYTVHADLGARIFWPEPTKE